MYFRKYRLRKIWLEKCLKGRVWEDSYKNKVANVSKLCCNLNGGTFTSIINHCERSLSWKKSLLVIHKILRLFAKTLIVDDKHYLLNRDNFKPPIQMQLSQKQKTFSPFLFPFVKSILNYKHFPKKMTFRAEIFPEITTPKNMVW